MSDSWLRRNAKAAYVARSLGKYGARVPLSGHGPLVLYAHELDGCPWRSMTRRATHIHDLKSMTIATWSHNLDRGDSFEQGWGVTHGVPAGVTIEHRLDDDDMAAILDVIHDKVGESMAEDVESMVEHMGGVILSGTPDFMAIQGDTLRIMDAKSPRKPWRNDDGSYDMKATWRSRLETYVRLAMKRLQGVYAHGLAEKLKAATPWPVRPGRLQPLDIIKSIHGVIVLDTGESYEFLELEYNEHALLKRMYEKLAKALTAARLILVGHPNGFLGMGMLNDEALAWLTGVNDEERAWQCGYCPLAHNCPVGQRHVVVLRLGPRTWERKVSKKGMEYYVTSRGDGDRGVTDHVAMNFGEYADSIPDEILTTDETLAKTNERHDVRVRVKKNGRVASWSTMKPPGRREFV